MSFLHVTRLLHYIKAYSLWLRNMMFTIEEEFHAWLGNSSVTTERYKKPTFCLTGKPVHGKELPLTALPQHMCFGLVFLVANVLCFHEAKMNRVFANWTKGQF